MSAPRSTPVAAVAPAHGSRLDGDFRRLWGAYAISELGSAVGNGALPLIALLVLDVSTLQISLLAALSAIAAAAIALPIGGFVEFHRKRPAMIAADLMRAAALISVPVAVLFDRLTFTHLCLVGIVQTLGSIVFAAASGAHLKALVPARLRLDATSRMETTFWTAISTGPPLGGVLISWLGTTVTLLVDAVSFVLSAVGVSRIRTPEPAPPQRVAGQPRRTSLLAGWHYIFSHRGLRALLLNSTLFGGCVMLASPLLAVLMLRDLGLAPWQYGLALGLPGLGGIIGAGCTKGLINRFGERHVMLGAGVARTLWLGLIPFAPEGTPGLVLIIVAETLLLFSAGVFNPTFVTYRLRVTADSHLARVLTSWSVTSKTAQPLFIVAGGVLATVTSTRMALAVAAILLMGSALLLPWRSGWDLESDSA